MCNMLSIYKLANNNVMSSVMYNNISGVICFHLQDGNSPLHIAAWYGRVDAVKVLHKCGGNMYCENMVS